MENTSLRKALSEHHHRNLWRSPTAVQKDTTLTRHAGTDSTRRRETDFRPSPHPVRDELTGIHPISLLSSDNPNPHRGKARFSRNVFFLRIKTITLQHASLLLRETHPFRAKREEGRSDQEYLYCLSVQKEPE